jgi:hypothetical protein
MPQILAAHMRGEVLTRIVLCRTERSPMPSGSLSTGSSCFGCGDIAAARRFGYRTWLFA